MSKRIIGSLVFAVVLGVLLFGVTLTLGGTSTQAQKAGGEQNGPKPLKAQPAGVWVDIAPFPSVTVSPTPGSTPLKLKRAGGAAYPPNGKVYLLGGRHGIDGEDVTLQWIWEYTPGNPGTWTRKNALLDGSQPGSRYTANMAVAVLTNTNGPRIYAVGGSSINSEPTPVVRIYDPNADAVTLDTDSWPANPVHVPGGYAVYNNKLYVFGGFSALGAGAVFSDTWVFDPMAAAGTRWTQLTNANLNLGRGYIAGAVLNGKIYAIGGDTWDPVNHTLNPVTNVERLDPANPGAGWTTVASLPTARGDLGAWAYDTGTGYEISGHIVVEGGIYPVPDNTGYIYDPGSNSWGSFPNLVHATRNYGVAQLNGMLYALGGYDYTLGTPSGANFNQAYDATIQGSPTNTPTGTPPTATSTPTITSTPCTSNYTIATATATIEPGTLDTGNHCDDCLTDISLPFSFQLYDQSFTTAQVSSNGQIDFQTGDSAYSNTCLSDNAASYAIFPYWDDLRTDGSGQGIFTAVTGTAPNRVFDIEWRAVHYSGGTTANFEVRLFEGQQQFEIVYGDTGGVEGTSATVGVQKADGSGNVYTEYECNTGGLTQGLALDFNIVPCSTPTFTPSPTVTPIANSPTPTSTNTPGPTNTATPTETPCPMTFTDVHPTDYFYQAVNYLYCHGVISGYADNTFRPYNNTTRGQMTKIVVLGFAIPIWTPSPSATPTFSDVPPTDAFYQYIETAAHHNIVSGYADGTFRPFNNVTRGQMTKIVVQGAVVVYGWPLLNPPTPTFSDVPPTNPFYTYIETAYCHQIISGYADGTFRWGNNATRGQISKIEYLAILNHTCGTGPAANVNIDDYLFVPQNVTVTVGSAVRWTNLDEVAHTSTSTQAVWDSGLLQTGQMFTYTFGTAGVFPYICTPHPWMTGTITVLGTR